MIPFLGEEMTSALVEYWSRPRSLHGKEAQQQQSNLAQSEPRDEKPAENSLPPEAIGNPWA
jgi:hypothetical protein